MVSPKHTSTPCLLHRSALALQQRARRSAALQRSYGTSEQHDGLGAVSCKDAGVGTTGRFRRRRKNSQHISLPHLLVHCHEVVRAKRARRLGGATEVLRSAQQLSFVSQLTRFNGERVHARDGVRRHCRSCARGAKASGGRARSRCKHACSANQLKRLGRRAAAITARTRAADVACAAPCQRRRRRCDGVALQEESARSGQRDALCPANQGRRAVSSAARRSVALAAARGAAAAGAWRERAPRRSAGDRRACQVISSADGCDRRFARASAGRHAGARTLTTDGYCIMRACSSASKHDLIASLPPRTRAACAPPRRAHDMPALCVHASRRVSGGLCIRWQGLHACASPAPFVGGVAPRA